MSREGKEMNRASWKKSPAELVERFAIALPEHPAVVRKPMFGYPAAFANGNMVCGLFQDSVVVRLGKEGAASAVADGRAQQFTPMPGRTMSGYVLVPTVEANDTRALAAWLQQALDFTLTLPKKAAKVPAKKASKAKPRKAR
jgi:TfoX/Sxy family transcriptional regulator of competence genes